MAERKVDHSALRTNQALIIGLLAMAFVLDAKWLVAFVSAVMLIGTIFPKVALFKAVYRYILKPAKIARPDVRRDNPEPHLFAQGVGGTVLLAATRRLSCQPHGIGLGAGVVRRGAGRAESVRGDLRGLYDVLLVQSVRFAGLQVHAG